MTDTTFPFEAAQADDAAFDEGSNRRTIAIIGGVVAALVLGAGGYLLLGGGGDTEDSFVAPHVSGAAARAAAAAAKAQAAAKAPKPAAKKLPVAYKEQIGRDPFKALYVVPVVTEAAPAAVGTSAVVGGTGADAMGSDTTPAAPVEEDHKLVLNRVYGTGTDRTGVFTIDGTQELAKVGSKFGPTDEIVLLSFEQGPKAGQWTVSLQVGDGDAFDVVTGVAAYVR